MTPTVGIDFDNTLVSYDKVIYELAVERGLVSPGRDSSKRAVRDAIRRLPDGEIEWQKIQAVIYGPLMFRAELMAGADEFINACRMRKWPVFIVSHKTEFAGYDETSTNLRDEALAWMTAQRFFDPTRFGFSKDQVFFEATRIAKIERIAKLGCTHFIDDLEEVLLEPSFPASTQKFLFVSWPALHDDFFAARS